MYIKNIRFIQLNYRNNKNIRNIHKTHIKLGKLITKNTSIINNIYLVEDADGAIQYNWL